MKELWWTRLTAETRTPSDKRRRLNRTMSNGPLKEAILATVHKTKQPHEFYGVSLHLLTPIHHNIFVIDPDTQNVSELAT